MQKTSKSITIIAVLCGCFLFTACGKKTTEGGGSASSSSSDQAGNASIEFFNNLLGFRKLAFAPLSKIMDTSKASAAWIEREKVTNERPRWNMVLLGINPYQKLAESKLTPPGSFSSEDKDFFNSRIKITKDSTGELNKIIDMLTNYYKAEDYKDDKHRKFLDTQPRIEALVEQTAKACNEMLERADVIATAAERKILEKRPDGVFVLSMRDIMEKCSEQMDILTDDRLIRVGSNTSFTAESKAEAASKVKDLADAAEALTAEINRLAEKAQALDRGPIKNNQSQARAYDDFFNQLEKEQGAIRKTIRFVREWGYVGNAGDMRNLRNNLSGMTSEHNNFIK